MFDEREYYDKFNDELDCLYESIEVMGIKFTPSEVLCNLDSIAYTEEFNNWLDRENLVEKFDNEIGLSEEEEEEEEEEEYNRNFDETFSVLIEEFPKKSDFEIRNFLYQVFSFCESLDKLNEKSCNEGLSDKEEVAREKIEDEYIKICFEFGVVGIVNGDPRGCACKFELPSKRSNSIFERAWNIISS